MTKESGDDRRRSNVLDDGDLGVRGVFGDPNKGLMMITVMFQRAAGYDPDNQDWFWAGFMPDGAMMQNGGMAMVGRVAKGMETGCIACHSNAPGGDYIVLHDGVGMR